MRKAAGLEYEEHGQGDPLLLIHGAFISDALSLLACEPALTERYRVIWYRRRGYGGSDPVSPPYSISQQAGDAEALLAHLGIERAHVVGHSGGGVIAAQLAMQAPKLVRSLVLLEPAIFPPALGAAFQEMLVPAMEAYGAGNATGAVDAFMDIVQDEADWRGELAKVLPVGPEQANTDAHVTFDIDLPQIQEWVFDGDAASLISSPVAYFWGSESGPLYETLTEHFLSLLPKSDQAELPGVDHSMNTTNPALVAGAVAEFLGRQP